MKKLFAITSIALLSTTAFAAEAGKTETGVDYNEIGISYISLESQSTTYTGYGIGASYLLSDSIFINGSFGSVKHTTTTIEKSTASLGYRMPIAANTDLLATVGYTYSTGASTLTQDTYPMSLGIRAAVSPEVDVGASVLYVSDTAKDQTGFAAGLKYKLSNNMFISGEYRSMKATNTSTSYAVGVGIKF